jgi:hypothetical protein
MGQGIALGRPVSLAVRQVLQDGRNWIVFGISWHPHARSQAAAVAQGNPTVFDFARLPWKFRDDSHRHPSAFAYTKGGS